eukprot:CAMPEP_0198148040 /NCGR_PEP_ID=MMETSP1443-20131203/39362_1 /TAXON_ID=186043 /ORGANISM="Entomoneis sp., Strain CCMP2396" /LENGTH=211 /DNA_ID=CAMNT_0043812603 /DNA_START=78 /DNA_END=710 /DNA_ORIENTATION=+
MFGLFSKIEQATSDDPFCMASHSGGGMVMYMDGFRRTLRGNHPCLNLFSTQWTLDSKGKFMIAAFGVYLMAITVEGMSKIRRQVVLAAKAADRSSEADRTWRQSILRLLVTVIHGTQALLGYLLMLATMTFSVELFFSVILGLATGYAVFFRHDDPLAEHHVTSNPCCNFMEGEAREIQGEQEASIHRDSPQADSTTSLNDNGESDILLTL